MKKAVLLIVVCLMVIFVFCPIIQAQGKIDLKWIHTYPLPPYAVPNDGTGEAEFRWGISFSPPLDESCPYTFIINCSDQPDLVREERIISAGSKGIEDGYAYLVPKDLPAGWYRVYLNVKETTVIQNFFVGAGNLKILKFLDTNRNGEQDDNEPGLSGVIFTIYCPKGGPLDVTTGTEGTYIEHNLMEGKYNVTEQSSRWIRTTPPQEPIILIAGKTEEVIFGNSPPNGTLSIFKFNNRNNNSIRDPGEEGLEGWEFEIRQDGRLGNTCVTDPNGYCVRSLRVGTYTITERLKSGWWVTSPNPVVIEVKAEETTNVEFGNHYPLPGNLSIFKFNDLNNNSISDPGEEGLEGWEFEIKQDGSLVDTCVTDPNGYCVRSLRVGTYTITERPKSGWRVTTPNPIVREVKAGETTNVKFGNYLGGRLSIFKFNDSDQNGRRGPGEGGLEGWKFEIRQDGSLVDTYVTDPKGYCVRSMPEGTYTITERLKSDWVATTPNPVVIEVKAGQTTNVEFGNYYPYGNLSIFKFNDRNNNSIRDPGEGGLEGWKFEIMQDSRLVDTCVTDPNGYCVLKLLEGRYSITEQQRRCWVSTTPTSRDRDVRAGQTTEVEFGNYAIGNLTIQKFYDDSRNKVQEYGEDGLPNWIFTITFPDGSSKRITTDANGTYNLLNVPIGRYTITEEAMTCRWTNSTSTTQYVEVTACQETIASFGNYIADCSIPPGCPWFNEDENLNVSKSVVPCVCNITLLREGESTSKEEEPEVSVYLRVCVDKRLIKDGIAVENITVVETLHNHFTIVGDSFSEQPSNTWRNPDGTTTMEWDIPSLCCEEWNVFFNATPEYALPIDVTDTSEQVTSKVVYEDPIETGRRELSIPEGKLKFSFIVPPAPLHPICYLLGGLLVLSISIEITLELKRRKKEKPKEKE